MNNLFVLSVISIMAVFTVKVNATEITVLETGYGTGLTIEEANKKALDDARMKVILTQPKATYTDTTIINERAKYKVITIPAQIVSIEAMSAELNVHLPTDTPKKDVFIASSSKVDRLDLNKEGHPKGTTYQSKVEFKFRVLPSSDVDRAKFLKEYMEMKDFIKNGEFKSTPEANNLTTNHKHIFKDIRAIQIVSVKGEAWGIDDYLLSSQDIDRAVNFYKNNYLDALVNTYQDFEVSVFNSGIEHSSGYGPKKNLKYQVVTVTMNGGCDPISIKNMGNDAAGNLCDLYKTLPESVKETIKRKGMNNGSDERFSNEEYLFDPLHGVKIMPTTSDKRKAPINYGSLISRNVSNSFFSKQEAVDTYSQEAFRVVTMFIASAIFNEPPVILTILIGQEGKHIDIPITSNTYLLGNKISVAIASNQIQGGEITADDISPILWNGKYQHPVSGHWKQMKDVAVVSLPEEMNLDTQVEFLTEVRQSLINKKEISTGTMYGHEQEYSLTSPINYAACNLNNILFKKLNCAHNDVFLTVGEFPSIGLLEKNYLKLGNIKMGFELKSNKTTTKEQCWAYSFKTHNLEECSFIKKQHWSLTMGSTPALSSNNSMTDIKSNSSKSGQGRGDEIYTKTSTNPSLIW